MAEESKAKQGFRRVWDIVMRTTNGMAIGLFGTLIIGTILDLYGMIPNLETMKVWSSAVKSLMGAGIGLGVGLALKKQGVSLVAIMAAGFLGNFGLIWVGSQEFALTQWTVASFSDPLSCYVAAMVAAVALHFIMRRKTPVDLILIPLVALIAAISYSVLLAEWVHYVTLLLGKLIEVSFAAVAPLMCIVVSALMGMALTAPISSVAICTAIHIGNVPLAAASALIGCCTQMLGFAVHTSKDNKWGAVLAVGLGTSMLQFKNILRKPVIWLPTIVISAALGPFALLCPMNQVAASSEAALSVGAGMGTSGLVGPINFLATLGFDSWLTWVLILCVCIAAPILLTFLADLALRKAGVLKEGDFALKAEI